MCGVTASSCGRWFRTERDPTGTWITRTWVFFLSIYRIAYKSSQREKEFHSCLKVNVKLLKNSRNSESGPTHGTWQSPAVTSDGLTYCRSLHTDHRMFLDSAVMSGSETHNLKRRWPHSVPCRTVAIGTFGMRIISMIWISIYFCHSLEWL